MITIGFLTEFICTRALPDYESYMVLLLASSVPALLPRKYALKNYKVGETGWATIFSLDGTYTILSQRAPQYTRKMLEYLINEELTACDLKICRVAKAERSTQYKVAVRGEGNALELHRKTRHLKDTIAKYIYGSVFFIQFSRDPDEYVRNALLPAPRDGIRKVIHRKDINQMDVYVDKASAGIFLGKQGNNVASASKLTGFSIKIFATD
jgi:transcription antitermination factor NusA-like protein